jgi:hypothetical protein
MKSQSSVFRNSLFLLAVILAWLVPRTAAQSNPKSSSSLVQAASVPARITQAIDETQLVRLQGNVHPLALPDFDQGIVADATPMKRMMLVLQRSPEQQAALSKFMDEQLGKDSPNYHNWLSPQEFGKLYGPADADIQAVTDWLARQGFQEIKVGAGRTAIEFSGNVGQVRNAFHSEIHQFTVHGEARQANVSDPQIPVALGPVVAGVLTLHNFPRESMSRVAGIFTRTADGRVVPQFTIGVGSFFAVGPADFAKIYNIPASLDGTGQHIAIVADSNINPQDVADFRNLFGLPANPPNIIVNGPDPGPNPDQREADLDVQVAGMVAPKATIDLVVSEATLTAAGIDLSAFYIIDNNIAPVMSVSFGTCEAKLGATANSFFNALWEQAAAQGITVMISSGDGNSAGCDNFNRVSGASLGLAVNGFASTPFNVAVGGTDFDDFTTQSSFWSTTNSADGKGESALGYIHEIPWNNSCAATATSATLNSVCAAANGIVGGSGGPSSIYAKPAWQNGIIPPGIAAGDNHRYLPDVSLFASNGPQSNSFYLVCKADAIPPGLPPSCVSSNFSFLALGGTSASAPAFAGIMALINQNNGRQGNANPVLYKIASTAGQSCNSSSTPLTGSATCSFYDITKGNNSAPCAGGSPNCSSTVAGTNGVLVSPASPTTPAWSAATGYDLATGLGSVNVANLTTQWPLVVGTLKSTSTTLKINGSSTPVAITHGTPVTAAVTVTSASGTPTGDFSILPANSTLEAGIVGSNTGKLSGNTTTISGVFLPGGSYSVTAQYAGDGMFAPSVSAGVPVTVNKESSRLQYGIVTFDPASGNIISTNATSFAYGSPYILRMDILNGTGGACQPLVSGGALAGCALDASGSVTITDNGSKLDAGTFAINTQGHAEDQPIQLTAGNHLLSAIYSGDNSYNPVTIPVTDSVMVSKASTTTILVSSAPTVTLGTNVTLTAGISTPSNSRVNTTGTVTFFNGGTQIGNPLPVSPRSFDSGGGATLVTQFNSLGPQSITATYSGDNNYSGSNAAALNVTVTSPGSFAVSYSPNPVVLNSTTGANAMSSVTVTPSGGFMGPVTVVCPTALNLPPGVSCTAPAPINIAGASPVAANLTLAVTATSTALTASTTPAERNIYAAGLAPSGLAKGFWGLSAVTCFAALILLFLPGRKRYRATFGLGLVGILSFTLGCGGGYGGGGPVATTTHISVPAPGRVASGGAFTFTATVTGGTPTDQVQLFDNGVAIGTGVAVSGGTATLVSPALAVGTHSISAHYAGDAYNTQASQSGSLNVTVTGSTNVAITTNPVATPPAPALGVTIN